MYCRMHSIKISALIFALTILIFILQFILIFPILILIFALRLFVNLLQKVLKPELYGIIPASSARFLANGIENEEKTNILVTAKVNGRINPTEYFDKVSQVFQSCSEGNQLNYPELKMYPKDWLGYPFWCPEVNFSIEEHVHLETIPEGKSSEEFIAKREKEFLKEPFQIEKSPWKIVLLEGKIHESILFLKFHHCLGDGVAILNLLTKTTDDCQIQEQNHVKQATWTSLIISWLSLPIVGPFKLAEIALDNFNPWYDVDLMNSKQMEPKSIPDRIISKSEKLIECSQIKNASRNHRVSFSAIIFGATIMAVDDFVTQYKRMRRGLPPSIVRVGTSVPLPWARKGKLLQNHATATTLGLYLNPDSSSHGVNGHEINGGIFQMCESEITVQRKSGVLPLLCACVFQILGSMPKCILSKVHNEVSINVSNFRGPSQALIIQGNPIQELYYNVWVGDFTPLFLSFFSYNGEISIVGNGDSNVFKSKKILTQFLNNIQKYIELAYNKNKCK